MPATLNIDPNHSTGEPSLARSQGSFPESEFVTIENVPTFAEHETKTPDGRTLTFGPVELQAVVDRCNRRITESGDYAVCCLGHTPSHKEKAMGAAMPDVVGFVGPFRLGRMMLPSGAWKYLILADYHIYKSDYERFRRHPRRSPELWLEDRYEDMFLDPIAMLGAEPPRLDMGLLYSRHFTSEGRERIKYSAAPGAMNTFIPDDRLRHQAEGTDMENIDEVIRGVVEAISELPVFRWAETKMQEENTAGMNTGGMGDGTAPAMADAAPEAPPLDAAVPPVDPVAAPPAMPAEAPAPEPAADIEPPAPEPEAEPAGDLETGEEVTDPAERERNQKYEALDELTEDMDDDEFEQYAAARRSKRSHRRKGYEAEGTAVDDGVEQFGETQHYSRAGDVMKYAKQITDLKNELAKTNARIADADRRAKLVDMHINDGVVLDVDSEMERLCYQRMPKNEDFSDACKSIAKNYQRIPIMGLPPALGDDAPVDRQRYQKDNAEKLVQETIRRCDAIRAKGQEPVFESVYAEVVAQGR